MNILYNLENEVKITLIYGVGMLLSIDNTDVMAVWNVVDYVPESSISSKVPYEIVTATVFICRNRMATRRSHFRLEEENFETVRIWIE